MKRVSISLPDDLVSDLDTIAEIVGSSRAGLVSGMLHGMNLPEIRRILELGAHAHSEGDGEATKRFRGESAEYIVKQLQRAMNPQGGLFDED